MAKTLAQLTETQQAAYAQIIEAGVWYAYNGISRATIAVLEREGFVTIDWAVTTTTTKTKRTRTTCDWKATPVKAEEPEVVEAPKAPAKPAKTPHGPTLVRLAKELGFERANMPEAGGFIVHEVLWEMVPVFMIGWAYAEDNTRERELSYEVTQMADLFKDKGYALDCFRLDRNFFFVIPESLVPFRRTA